MVEVNERIEVPASPRAVWDVLSNPRVVVECVPGAELGEQQEDGSFDAMLLVKFGPAKVSFKARVWLELDAAAMSGKVTGKGKDSIGGTRVQTDMKFNVVGQAEPPASTISITAEVEISGKLASLIETGSTLVVKYMVSEFSERLAARCAGQPRQP
jgi:carbon monoxide dehydrogenase subunit G